MEMTRPDTGSFRDPGGRVFVIDGHVYRSVMPTAVDDYEFVRSTGLIQKLIGNGQVIPETVVDPNVLGAYGAHAHYVLEHPMLPIISYPYEWSFPALKAAALLQLDVHLTALAHGVTLSDASAYNIQFRGPRPVFIDSLSFRRYREGEFWIGHRQFCEQYINPLLLRALIGVPHNSWYRGALEGIHAQELCPLLRWSHKFSWNVLTHVVMQARLQGRATNQLRAEYRIRKRKLSPMALRQILRGLRKWIAKLEPADTAKTVWADYAGCNSYESEGMQAKHDFVADFSRSLQPDVLWDIGCNTGDYSKAALESGATFVVGFDSDQDALNLAFERAIKENLNFLPLYMDAANQSPSQGWAQSERSGLMQRASADGILALAVVHHLSIGRNVPLQSVVDWLVEMAPEGIIEFVQKSDPMVQSMLRLRDDIFSDYSEDSFVRFLKRKADIVRVATVSSANRRLFWFRRR
jgi:ribosomal protein L11 methylase PrmA